MKLFHCLVIGAIAMLAATPAQASPITMLVGDKDGFGLGIPAGGTATWVGYPGPLVDSRSAGERAATTGAQLTDVYSALYYYGTGSGCDTALDPGCSPNGDTGFVSFAFSGRLLSASITMLMGDFECVPFVAMTVDINGVGVPFCFSDGFQSTVVRTFALTPQMIAAANLAGQVRMNFDHRADYDENGIFQGSFDYIAFDYFELNADVQPVPEPATLSLLGVGLAALASRRRWRRHGRPAP